MRDDEPTYRFYGDLAEWWPLISPPDHYEEEAAFLAGLLDRAPGREVLELGSGGGHNAVHLAGRFDLTLVDRSPAMLAVSRRLLPDVAHVEGDMRSVRLERRFDAVLVHDAIAYLTTEADVATMLRTAHLHLRPGGVVVLAPDHTTERFAPGTDHGGSDGPDGRGVRYLEWIEAPTPGTSEVRVHYAFVLRDADGSVRSVGETHRCGLFGRDTWLRLLDEAGFDAEAVEEVTTEDRLPRELFVGRRRAAESGGSR